MRDAAHDERRRAMEIQSALEGMAARFAAERGVEDERLEPLRSCLAEFDALLERPSLEPQALAEVMALNARFQDLVLRLIPLSMVVLPPDTEVEPPLTVEEISTLEMASPTQLRSLLVFLQNQHHAVVRAIETGAASRIEDLVRERVHTVLSLVAACTSAAAGSFA